MSQDTQPKQGVAHISGSANRAVIVLEGESWAHSITSEQPVSEHYDPHWNVFMNDDVYTIPTSAIPAGKDEHWRFPEAEAELRKAIALDPVLHVANPDFSSEVRTFFAAKAEKMIAANEVASFIEKRLLSADRPATSDFEGALKIAQEGGHTKLAELYTKMLEKPLAQPTLHTDKPRNRQRRPGDDTVQSL